MKKYIYFSLHFNTSDVLNRATTVVKTMCRKSFDLVFDEFTDIIKDKKMCGYIGRCELLKDGMLDDIEYVTGTTLGAAILDCFDIKFIKQKNNMFNATALINDYGKESLIGIAEKFHNYYSPKKKIEPLDPPESLLNFTMNRIEEASGSKIKDTTFFIQTIKFELENGDICLVKSDDDDGCDFKYFSENYWFKNEERIMKQYEGNYWKAN